MSKAIILSEDLKGAFEVSCPGKVILFGEHSVVYDKLAIALSVDLRTRISVNFAVQEKLVLDLPAINLRESWSIVRLQNLFKQFNLKERDEKVPKSVTLHDIQFFDSFLEKSNYSNEQRSALTAFFHLYNNLLPEPLPFTLKCQSDVPVGGGLGSSAAFGVCITTALLNIYHKYRHREFQESDLDIGNPEILERIRQWSFICEKVFHGSPSGIDNAICTYGGGVTFKKGAFNQFNMDAFNVLLVNTRVPRSTKALVSKVKEKSDKYPSIIDPILNAMDELANESYSTLQKIYNLDLETSESQECLEKTLEELVEMNHSLLTVLGVSHPSLEKIVSMAKSFGMAAKLTGAGGGGFAVILCHKNKQELMNQCQYALESHGYETWETKLGTEGVKLNCSDLK